MYHLRPRGCRVSDEYTYRGMRLLVMENELVRATFLLDKGADLIEFTYKPLDADLMWHSPAGVRNPYQTVLTSPHPGGNFTDFYPGGWQIIFPSGSGASTYEGAEFGQHGEACFLVFKSTILTDEPDEVAVRLTAETLRSPYRLDRVVRLERGKAALLVEERVQNLSQRSLHYMWGQHIAFGEPLVGPGCRLCLPPGRVISGPGQGRHSRIPGNAEGNWPYLPDDTGKLVDLRQPVVEPPAGEMLYRTGMTDGWAAMINPEVGVGVGIQWPTEVWPILWIWQEVGAGTGFPWYGRARTIALEPFTSLPGTGRAGLEEAIAGGTAALIGPGGEQKASYQLLAFPTKGSAVVTRIAPGGEVVWG